MNKVKARIAGTVALASSLPLFTNSHKADIAISEPESFRHGIHISCHEGQITVCTSASAALLLFPLFIAGS